MKRFCLLFFSVAMAIAMNAGDLKEEIVGKWLMNINQDGNMVLSVYDFQNDGTMIQETSITGKSPKMDIMAIAKCTYICDDEANSITFKISANDIEISKFFVEGLDPAYAQMAIEYQKNQMANQEMKVTDVKIEGKVLTGKLGKEEITLTRM